MSRTRTSSLPTVGGVSILFVCQGNVCRSPAAERLTTLWAAEALGAQPERAGIRITSAGLGAQESEPMHPLSAAALAGLGGNSAGFLSRRFVPGLAHDAALVLTRTTRQRRSVLETTPMGLRRTFTLPEAAALLPLIDRSALERMAPRQRVAKLAELLDAARARRPAPHWEDIADPIGGRSSAHQDAVQRIASSLRPLVEVLFGPARTSDVTQPVSVTAGRQRRALPTP